MGFNTCRKPQTNSFQFRADVGGLLFKFPQLQDLLARDYPDDVGHSKLPQAMSKAKFPKLVTARNWNTVLKLVELTK